MTYYENSHLLRESSRSDREQRRKRSIRNLESPTGSLRLRMKQDPPNSYLESPLYSSESDTNSFLSHSDVDSDSNVPYSPLSLQVSIPRCYHDLCHEVSSDEGDRQFDCESPYNSSSTQVIFKQTRGLTARQKAISGLGDNALLELPYYKPKELTEEMRAKKAEVALQRRIHNQQQMERNKEETIRKLLSRQTPAKKKEDNCKASRYNPDQSYVSYISNCNATTMTYPDGADIDLTPRSVAYPPMEKPSCVVPTCSAASRYRHPRTLQPYCSLRCYRIISQPSAPNMEVERT